MIKDLRCSGKNKSISGMNELISFTGSENN